MPTTVFNAVTTGGHGLAIGTSNTTWATVRGATNASSIATDAADNPRSNLNGANYEINRYFFSFDTSGMGAGAVAGAATLTITADTTAIVGNADSTTVEVVQSTQTSPPSAMVVGDYSALTFTSGGNIPIASLVNSTPFNITLNATGLGFINPTGFTKIAIIIGRDLSNTAPTGIDNISILTPDNGTPANRPTLSVTYTQPGRDYAMIL